MNAALKIDSLDRGVNAPVQKALFYAQKYEFALRTHERENVLKEEEKTTMAKVATCIGQVLLLRTHPQTDKETKACLDRFTQVHKILDETSREGSSKKTVEEEIFRLTCQFNPTIKSAVETRDKELDEVSGFGKSLESLKPNEKANYDEECRRFSLKYNPVVTTINTKVRDAVESQAKENLKQAKTIGYIGMAAMTTVTGIAFATLYLRNKK